MLIQNINNDHVINLIMAGNYMRDIIMCASPFYTYFPNRFLVLNYTTSLHPLSKPTSRIKFARLQV